MCVCVCVCVWGGGGGGGPPPPPPPPPPTTLPISLSLPLLAISPLVSAAKPSIGFSKTPSYYSSLEMQPQAMFRKK